VVQDAWLDAGFLGDTACRGSVQAVPCDARVEGLDDLRAPLGCEAFSSHLVFLCNIDWATGQYISHISTLVKRKMKRLQNL
jgi:hypothetical protein